MILRNWFSVVAEWKRAIFSLTKKVSGTQMSLMYSAPTTVQKPYYYGKFIRIKKLFFINSIFSVYNFSGFPNFSKSSCLSKANLKYIKIFIS